MKSGGWAAATLATIVPTARAAGAAQAACQLAVAAEYKVVMVQGQPLVEAMINGKPVRMTPDLGAQTTFLTVTAAKALGLDTVHQSITVYGPGGNDQALSAQVKDLQLGRAVAHNVDLLVIDARPQAGGAVGRIGRDFLTAFDLEFDLQHGAIRQFQAKGCEGDTMAYWGGSYVSAPLYLPGGYGRAGLYGPLQITIGLNGKPARATIVSTNLSLVDTDTAARVGVTPDQPGVKLIASAAGFGPDGKPTKIYGATFDSFTLGDETVKNPQLRIGAFDVPNRKEFTGSHILRDPVAVPEMQLGVDFLWSHRVYIAWSQGKVYASYLGGAPFGERPPTTPAAPASVASAADK